jgi:undecaprenyl-diphosphatase
VTVTAVLAAMYRHHDRAGWLDAAVDPRLQASAGTHPALLTPLVRLGDPPAGVAMTLALVLACAAVRRWRGALLAGIAVPAASALTELVLKPVVGRTLHGALSFPSGHATSMFALAAACAVLLASPPRTRLPGPVRASLVLAAVLVAGLVAAAMVALNYHYATDAVAGAATGTGVVLLTAVVLDWCVPGARRKDPAPGRPLPEATQQTQPGVR